VRNRAWGPGPAFAARAPRRFGEAGPGAWGCELLLAVLLVAGATPPGSEAFHNSKPQASRPRRQAPTPKPQALSRDLTRIFNSPSLESSYWSVVVRSLDTGRTIFSRNASKLMMPASNMKVVTLAAVAERLGWDFRFETHVMSDASVADGVLGGDLLVIGSGDPSMNARHDRSDKLLEDVACQLREAGIRAILGRVLSDDGLFAGAEIGGGWSWDYLQFGYAAPVNALAYAENLITVVVEPGSAAGEPALVAVTPLTSDLAVVNRAATSGAGSEQTIEFLRERGATTLEVTGTIPLGSPSVRRTAAVEDPGLSFARALRDGLIRHGIDVRGEAAEPLRTPSNPLEPPRTSSNPIEPSRPSNPLRTLARIVSPPLWEMATVLMKSSQNLYAEMLLRAIGNGTIEGARKSVTELLASWNIKPEQFVLADGSGLSRYNYVTADMLVAILERMYRDPRHRERFMATLPIAGVDGTLERRMRGGKAQDNVRAKTGSIANARSLSGYIRTAGGEMLAFSIIGNNFTMRGMAIDEITDKAVEAMARSR
jgi:serine-type D-Ala-D-Ala carboxypeptidase/endopeptidase (penicillin-binding protein 4)